MVVHFELGMTEDESKLSGRCLFCVVCFHGDCLLCVCLIGPTQKLEFGVFFSAKAITKPILPWKSFLGLPSFFNSPVG